MFQQRPDLKERGDQQDGIAACLTLSAVSILNDTARWSNCEALQTRLKDPYDLYRQRQLYRLQIHRLRRSVSRGLLLRRGEYVGHPSG